MADDIICNIMRLWHQSLIPYLDNKRLLGQHRECCALRGKGWGKKHSVVNYVFKHPYRNLYHYHLKIICEMESRGYNVDQSWRNQYYRGKTIGDDKTQFTLVAEYENGRVFNDYHEHNDAYLKECLLNLQSKGAELINGTCISEQLLKLAIEGRA